MAFFCKLVCFIRCCTSILNRGRFFKKYTGESFLNFLNKYRLAKACYILENKEESIEDVAYQSGFQSYQTFYAQFKRHFGVSPHQYNKDNIQE
jgi:AraC-like DNA-binding protein